MAGVSLRLRELFGSRSVLAQTLGYAYAGTAMAGPWFLTSFTLIALNAIPLPGLSALDRGTFQVLVLYGYCGSMLLTGGMQLVVARHVSDQLYVGDVRHLTSTYLSTALISLLLHGAVAWIFVLLTRPPALLAVAEVAFFGTLGLVWTGMIFLGTLRSFLLIFGVFVAGVATSLGACAWLGPPLGAAGLLGGFAVGQALIAAFFTARIRSEFPSERTFDLGFLRTLAAHPSLLVMGLAMGAGVWIDKIIYWLGPFAVRSESGFRSFPLYDNAMFLAYLTVAPALVLLFIRFEVSFHDACRRFHGAIRHGGDLETIRLRRREVMESFTESVQRVITLQGVITLMAILFAPRLLEWVGIDWVQYYVFRIACLGAFLQVLSLTLMLALIHLAFYRLAVLLSVTSLLVCGAATWAAMKAGLEYTGYGYAAAGFAALAVTYPLLKRKLGDLERRTFMG